MDKKLSKIVGVRKVDFDAFVISNQIQMSPAKLIPFYKIGDEMALTSIFLSSLRLIKEFREALFSEIKLIKGGQAYYCTEISFPDIGKSRIDGMVYVVSAGIIKDVAFFEMKNKNNVIDSDQIKRYQEIAKKLGVRKMVTVSNEFVPHSSMSPTNIRSTKSFTLFHLSWTYILTRARILLFNNDKNIKDSDQVEIMKEVVSYFENKASGVSGFTQMKPSWKEVVERIISGARIKQSDMQVIETVMSWQQEEKDLALMMSRELGVLVKTGSASKSNASEKLNKDLKMLVNEHHLISAIKVVGAVSDISIDAGLDKRTVSMSVKLSAPLDKGVKARYGWIIRQLENSRKKNLDAFNKISNELWVEAQIKFSPKNIRIKYTEIEKLYDIDKTKEAIGFKLIVAKDFGKNFSSSKNFIVMLESLALTYYEGVVQNLGNWKQPAPKIR